MKDDEGPAKAPTEDLMQSFSPETVRTLTAIGNRVRDLRRAKGLTLQQLAHTCALSTSMLSLVERGLASPSIGSLVVICDALGTNISELMSDRKIRDTSPVIRAEEARIIETADHVIWRIMKDDRARGVSITVNEYAPGTGSSERMLHHEGFEYGLVLIGTLTVEIDSTSYSLNSGDLICYSSTREHRIWNHGDGVARAVWFNMSRA